MARSDGEKIRKAITNTDGLSLSLVLPRMNSGKDFRSLLEPGSKRARLSAARRLAYTVVFFPLDCLRLIGLTHFGGGGEGEEDANYRDVREYYKVRHSKAAGREIFMPQNSIRNCTRDKPHESAC